MAELGRAALIATLGLSLYALAAGAAAAAMGRRRLALSARNALVAASVAPIRASSLNAGITIDTVGRRICW